jgi:hypothetical protein
MQKLLGKDMDMLYRSCSVFHQESKKLSLNFSEFLAIFYAFYKIQHLHHRSRRNGFTNRSSDFADRPSGRKLRLQLGAWRHGQRRELDSGQGKARLGRERVGECLGTHLRPIPGVGWLRGRAGEGARRHHALAAAATGLPANRSLSLEHKRLGEL